MGGMSGSGVIQTISEECSKEYSNAHVEWLIPDFFVKADRNTFIYSPEFSFSGCTCELGIFFQSKNCPGFMSLRLDVKDSDENFTCTIGWKKSNGTVSYGKSYELKGDGNSEFVEILNLNDLPIFKSELEPSGTVTISCRMERGQRPVHTMQKQQNPSPEPPCTFSDLENLSSDLRHFFGGQKRCDVTIKVRDKEFQCHRAVLMARSPNYFCPMFEHDTKEAQEGVVEEQDCDPDSYEKFLHYLYTGKVENVTFQEVLHLYVTADKYDVQKLKSFCGEHLVQNLTPENLCDVAVLAERYEDTTKLESSAQAFFNRNFCNIVQTAEWESLLIANPRLGQKFLKRMVSKVKIIEVTDTV